jgi:hypothetical protein
MPSASEILVKRIFRKYGSQKMGEIAALSSKGIVAIPHLLEHFGPFPALFAFFAVMPLGHMTVGILVVVLGAFYPALPSQDETHEVKLGTSSANLAIKGSARTALTVTSVKLVEIRDAKLRRHGRGSGGVKSRLWSVTAGERDRRHSELCYDRSAAIKPCAFGAPRRGCGA